MRLHVRAGFIFHSSGGIGLEHLRENQWLTAGIAGCQVKSALFKGYFNGCKVKTSNLSTKSRQLRLIVRFGLPLSGTNVEALHVLDGKANGTNEVRQDEYCYKSKKNDETWVSGSDKKIYGEYDSKLYELLNHSLTQKRQRILKCSFLLKRRHYFNAVHVFKT